MAPRRTPAIPVILNIPRTRLTSLVSSDAALQTHGPTLRSNMAGVSIRMMQRISDAVRKTKRPQELLPAAFVRCGSPTVDALRNLFAAYCGAEANATSVIRRPPWNFWSKVN
jgi:hypothetical protein